MPERRVTNPHTGEEPHESRFLKFTRKTFSIKERAEQKQLQQELVQQRYPAYADLPRERLEGYLKNLFREQQFNLNIRKENNAFIFSIPKRLTEAERADINNLRDCLVEEERPPMPEE